MELSKEELGKLLEEAVSGSEDAARQLTERYGHYLRVAVRRWLHKRLRTQFDSLDFVQDVWASFFARGYNKTAFNDPKQLIELLRRMARNKVVTVFRRKFQTQKANINREQSLQEAQEKHGLQLIDRQQATPSQIVSGDEEWEKFLNGQLPAYREVLRRYGDGRDVPTIARELAVSERTVRRVLRHVLDELLSEPDQSQSEDALNAEVSGYDS
jgi:RNA polymerase sigma-70 factor (ECF subfamily)